MKVDELVIIMKFAIGSINPAKVEATKLAVNEFFPGAEVAAVDAESKVSPQPSDDEMKQGAENRARAALKAANADAGIGLEGGLATVSGKEYCTACCAIVTKAGEIHFAYSPLFELPDKYMAEIKSGKELGFVIDEAVGRKNTKQDVGAIGVLSKGKMTRTDGLKYAVLLALMPLVHEAYKEKAPQKKEPLPKEIPESLALKKTLAEKTDQLLRLQADFDNYRKFLEKDKADFVKFANERIIVEMLGIVDDFERALAAFKDEQHKKAIQMILQRFLKTLGEFGVKEIEANGKKFNPAEHEAFMQEESDKEEGAVLEVLQKGYALNGKIIRHAKVKVSKNKR